MQHTPQAQISRVESNVKASQLKEGTRQIVNKIAINSDQKN